MAGLMSSLPAQERQAKAGRHIESFDSGDILEVRMLVRAPPLQCYKPLAGALLQGPLA